MLAMCSCGIFPVTTGKMHNWCSFAFLGLIPVILLFIGFEIKKLCGKKWWGLQIYSVALCLFHLAVLPICQVYMVKMCYRRDDVNFINFYSYYRN